MQENKVVLDFVKALADGDRLKIVGILARRPAGLVEITDGLSLPEREVSNHLKFLERVGVVHKNEAVFELDTNGLETLARRQFEGRRSAYSPEPKQSGDRQRILVTYLNPDGTIRQIPNSRTQAGKFRVILEYVIAAFEPGVIYTEKEVNVIIHRLNEDVSGLRRDLVDTGLIARERDGSKYWRPQ